MQMVPPAGFEPAISTLKGWRPGPLDDGDAAVSIAEAPFRLLADLRPRACPAGEVTACRRYHSLCKRGCGWQTRALRRSSPRPRHPLLLDKHGLDVAALGIMHDGKQRHPALRAHGLVLALHGARFPSSPARRRLPGAMAVSPRRRSPLFTPTVDVICATMARAGLQSPTNQHLLE